MKEPHYQFELLEHSNERATIRAEVYITAERTLYRGVSQWEIVGGRIVAREIGAMLWRYEMKMKLLLRTLRQIHYPLLALVLFSALLIPALNFLIMANAFSRFNIYNYDITVVIPFMAVIAAILVGFLLLPLLKKTTLRKKSVMICIVGVLVFIGLDMLVQNVAANTAVSMISRHHWHNAEVTRYSRIHGIPLNELMHTRSGMVLGPDGIPIPEYFMGRVWSDDFTYYTLLERNILNDFGMIPWSVRIHYYLFSIILILAALNCLVVFSETLSGNGSHSKKVITVQGVALVCYMLAYIFVGVMIYEDFAARHITWGSKLNSTICFILAAINAGLYSKPLLRFVGRTGRIVSSLIASATVFALYGAQYIMLNGRFYSFGSNTYIEFAIRALVAITPGIIIYLLLCFMDKQHINEV